MSKKWIKDFGIIILGNFLLAVAVSYFVIPFDILSGGVAGVAVAIAPINPFSIEITIMIVIVSMFILGAIFLGKEFVIKTIVSTISYPIFIALLAKYPIPMNIDPMLASFYAGVFGGIGIGIVFRVDASTGGMDIPPMIINKYTGISLSTLVLIVDGLTIMMGYVNYGVEKVLVGLLSVFVTSIVVNRVLVGGGQSAKSVLIISNHYEEISHLLQDKLERGVTMINAYGGYTKENRPIVMCVVYNKQYPHLHDLVYSIDSSAFLIVMDTVEVKGEGFSFEYKKI